ncbi:MAG: hypothetical protein LBT53_04265, partial [Puniceicoccales bacterium]|nr:hypothetical protein [Puniceicoccales bacterium]
MFSSSLKILTTAAVATAAAATAAAATPAETAPPTTPAAPAAPQTTAPAAPAPAAPASPAAEPVRLAPVEVTAARVAIPDPADSFAMPVTALRFDPLIDMQARGIGEAASDISIRGGTYLNTG